MRVHGLRRAVLRLVVIGLFCTMAPMPAWTNADDRPIVVLRIDDCSTTWTTPFAGLGGVSGLAYGKAKHIPITWTVITSLAQPGISLSFAQLIDYLDGSQYSQDGVVYRGELASHTVSHAAKPSQQAYIDEVIQSKAAIEAAVPGYACTTFMLPGVWTGEGRLDSFAALDGPVGQTIQANYDQSMAYLGGGWLIGGAYYRHGTTNNWAIDAQTLPTIANVNKRLDLLAATPGAIAVISGHAVQEQGQSGSYAVAADVLKATMDKLADLRDQGRIRLMSFRDAYHATFSPNLNHVPDPGFELFDRSIISDPWALYSAAQIVADGGVNNSRHIYLPDTNSNLQSSWLALQPGRYELSWYQRKSTPAVASLLVAMNNTNQNGIAGRNAVDWQTFYTATPGIWERKTALALVQDRLNISKLRFQPTSGGAYAVDDVSLVSAPIDPAVSPSASAVIASPDQCKVSWHTPNDPAITSVVVRYHVQTHPLTPTVGYALCTVPAVPAYQEITVPMNWTAHYNVYFSIFGIGAYGTHTPPDLAAIRVDRTAPTAPALALVIDPEENVLVRWNSSDPDSGVFQYQYAVGSTAGAEDIQPWTTTSNNYAVITGLQYGVAGYVSARAQNAFGFWSSVSTIATCPQVPTVTASRDPDGTIHVQWHSPDPAELYRYALGSIPGAEDVRPWVTTSDTSAMITGLQGTSLYASVEALAGTGGEWSPPGYAYVWSPSASVAQAHSHPDNDTVTVAGIVTAAFGDCCYIEDPDRARGIKVDGSISSFSESAIVTLTGRIVTDSNNERKITAE